MIYVKFLKNISFDDLIRDHYYHLEAREDTNRDILFYMCKLYLLPGLNDFIEM
jgi:hypothetical protein